VSRSHWKHVERAAAQLLGGRRYWANSGRAVDVEGPAWIAQIKNRKTYSLRQMAEDLLPLERQAALKAKGALLVVKASAGRGIETPTLVIMTQATFERLHGPCAPSTP
jgi:hypothetical protein